MKILVIVATALTLTGCNSIPGAGGSNLDLNAFLNSTTCAHDDELQGVTGAAGIPASVQFKVARHCSAAAPVVVGTVIGAPVVQ